MPLAAHLGIHSATHPQFAALARGSGVRAQVRFLVGEGFAAVSDNAHLARDPSERALLARELERSGLSLTSLTFHAPGEPPGDWTSDAFVD